MSQSGIGDLGFRDIQHAKRAHPTYMRKFFITDLSLSYIENGNICQSRKMLQIIITNP